MSSIWERFGETEDGVGGRGQARDATFMLEDLFPGGGGHGPLYCGRRTHSCLGTVKYTALHPRVSPFHSKFSHAPWESPWP